MKYWEIIADNLSKAGWSLGYVSAIDSNGRTFWIADAHRGDGKRCLKKERERNAHSPAPFMKTNNNFFVSYSSPEAAHGPIS